MVEQFQSMLYGRAVSVYSMLYGRAVSVYVVW